MMLASAPRTTCIFSRFSLSSQQRLGLAARNFAKAAVTKKEVKPRQQQKVVAAPKKQKADVSGGRPNDLQLILAALDAPMRQEPALSQEERDRRFQIGRNYVIGKFREHNEIHHDLACKLQLKKHAINMLPKKSKLREEALRIDDSGPPT
jgi:hypothetical protein